MKLHRSAKLAVTAGLALSMTMGAAVPAIAAEPASAAQAKSASKDMSYVNEDGYAAFVVDTGAGSKRVELCAEKNVIDADLLNEASGRLAELGVTGKLQLVTDAEGNASFLALVKQGDYYGLQLGLSSSIVPLSGSDGVITNAYVDAAKQAVATFLGKDKGAIDLNVSEGGSLSLQIGKKVTLHFFDDENDKVSVDATYSAGNPLIAWPSNPTREGYTFKGYKISGQGDRAYATPADMFKGLAGGKFDTVVSDMDGWNFVGVWEKDAPKTVTWSFYNDADATSPAAIVPLKIGSKLDSWTYTPHKDGYEFAGYSVNYPDGAVFATPADFLKVFNQANPTATTDSVTAAMDGYKLYAHWTKAETPVTWATATFYDADGTTVLGTADYQAGQPLSFWAVQPAAREGYTFEGYAIKGKESDGPVDPAKVTMSKDGMEFVAVWERNDTGIEWAKATFLNDDGSVLGTADYQVNEALNFWAVTPAAREGYTFEGYAIQGKDGVVDPTQVTMSKDGMTFVAVWKKNAPEAQWAKATFLDADGKTVIGTADYQVGEALNIWAVTPAPRFGYVFKGYYIAGKPDTIVNPKDVTMSKDGMTFVAVWQKCTPAQAKWAPAVFRDNGRVIGVRCYKVGQPMRFWKVTPEARDGFKFMGYAYAGSDRVVSPWEVVMGRRGLVLDAVWAKCGTPSKPTDPSVPSKPQSPFDDVAYAAWYAQPIAKAKGLGYVNGYAGTNLFRPNASITRADAVCVLFNMAGGRDMADDLFSKDGGKTFEAGFSDVAADAYYAKALAWAKATGVANGYAGTTEFKPGQTITREEFAALLSNYAKLKGEYEAPTKDLSSFNGADTVSDWAKEVVAWAAENGVMGNNGASLAGRSTITRAEVAAMAVNFQPAKLAKTMVK